MNGKTIEVQVLHAPKVHKDEEFGFRVLINGKDTFVTEIPPEDMLHIGALLLSAARKFINNAYNNKQNG